jgi:hypothetical protein
VPVCHYDADTGTYTSIAVSGNGKAVDAHLAHGDALPGDPVPTMPGNTFDDGCVPVPDEVILAVAYTDQDPDDGEYNADVDTLIAKVVGDGDGVPSTGDTIVTHQYPLDFDATAFGSFTMTAHTGALAFATAELLEYSSANGTFSFLTRDVGEVYAERVGTGYTTNLQDGHGIPRLPDPPGPNVDILEVSTASPSAPDTEVHEVKRITTAGDQFVDVELRYRP